MVHIRDLCGPQNHRCCYCGHRMEEIDKRILPYMPQNAATKEHVIPKSYGGETKFENLVAACSLCNYLRGNMDYIAFSNLIKKWFKQDVTLRARWHEISREERFRFKQQCLGTHERQLRGLGRKHILYRERHEIFISHYGDRFQKRA